MVAIRALKVLPEIFAMPLLLAGTAFAILLQMMAVTMSTMKFFGMYHIILGAKIICLS
jgi:hypothetical protein